MREGRRVGLVLVDVINGFDFEGCEGLVKGATQAAPRIEELAQSARRSGVSVIYVNDNFGMWQSNFRAVVEHCLRPDQPGREVVRRLTPQASDYFVLKPRHSGFLATPLQELLEHLGVTTLMLAGFATDLCVLSTALDAHARGFWIAVAADCTAANDATVHGNALSLLQRSMGASVLPAAEVNWDHYGGKERRNLF